MIFENMSLGILEVDKDEKIIYANDAMEKITGFKVEELIGNTTTQLFIIKPEQKERLWEVLENRKKGEASVYELLASSKNGSDIIMVVSGVPQFDEAGNYYVTPFNVEALESLNDNLGNGGLYSKGQTTGIGTAASEDTGVIKVSPGKAYVLGYEVPTNTNLLAW